MLGNDKSTQTCCLKKMYTFNNSYYFQVLQMEFLRLCWNLTVYGSAMFTGHVQYKVSGYFYLLPLPSEGVLSVHLSIHLFVWSLKLNVMIKSHRGDFMFLYQFVQCRDQLQTFFHAITFENLFEFLLFLAGHIDYLIRFWLIFVVTLTLNFPGQTWNFLYLSQKCQLPWNITWTYCLNTRPQGHQFWHWLWHLPKGFQGQIFK